MRKFIFISAFALFITSCNSNDSSQEEDFAQLHQQFLDIENFAQSETCTDAAEWSYTAIGEKACGGPTHYIAYSTQIDTAALFQMIDAYNTRNRELNMRWNIYSDCMVIAAPSGVECVEGNPVLVFN